MFIHTPQEMQNKPSQFLLVKTTTTTTTTTNSAIITIHSCTCYRLKPTPT